MIEYHLIKAMEDCSR